MNDNEATKPGDYYRQSIADRADEVSSLKANSGRLSRARGIVFLIALLFAFLGWAESGPPWLMFTLAGLAFIAFVAVVGYHEHVDDQRRTVERRSDLQRRQLGRVERDWTNVPEMKVEIDDEHRAVAGDLDLFSRGGLYHFLNRAHTPAGKTTLRDWLTIPALPEEIKRRQAAVQSLSKQREFCDDLDLHGSLLAASDTGPVAFTEWASSPDWYENRTGVLWGLRALAAAGVVLLGLILFGVLPFTWIYGLIALVCLNVCVNGYFIGGVHDIFNRITAGRNEIRHYAALLELVDGLPNDAEKLVELKSNMNSGDTSYQTALGQLQRTMRLAGGRRSALMFLPYICAQLLIYWDFDILHRLEKWKRAHGSSVARWFESLAEIESLSSLAVSAIDHPDWTYPAVDNNRGSYDAVQLGHPLLKQDEVCNNDVKLGPAGTFLLVTGSNMSGKSTLLRSIGINAVLAQAGGPVCAKQLGMPPVVLATSMRVTDSLNDGVSFFFAELKRLKQIVDMSRDIDGKEGKRLLFLLDEILQGTNSQERQIAVAQVIDHLLAQPTIGAVSTHDLELAAAKELSDHCDTVHFREHFTGDGANREMHFDYVLRQGVSPTTNALKLLEMVGLGPEA